MGGEWRPPRAEPRSGGTARRLRSEGGDGESLGGGDLGPAGAGLGSGGAALPDIFDNCSRVSQRMADLGRLPAPAVPSYFKHSALVSSDTLTIVAPTILRIVVMHRRTADGDAALAFSMT